MNRPPEIPGEIAPGERARTNGDRYLEVEQFARAEEQFRIALTHAPDNPWTHFALARTLWCLDRETEALEHTKQTLALQPGFAPAHGLLGVLEMHHERYHSAERSLLEGLRLDPTDAWLYEQYARLMKITGHAEKAEQLNRKALELDPESASAHAQLAALHAEAGRHDTATHHAEQGLGLAPEESAQHVASGFACLRSGRPFRARRHLRAALAARPDDADLETAFLETDRMCRWIYLPYYYLMLVIERLPGKTVALWVGFIVISMGMRRLNVAPRAQNIFIVSYLSMCVYTWVAPMLVKGWVRLVPPR